MKKLIFLFSVFLVLLMQTAMAQNITLSLEGSSFIAGQTVIAKVSMERFSLSKFSVIDSANSRQSIGFYQYDLGNNEHIVYFNLPSAFSGDYKLLVSDKRLEQGIFMEDNATALFSVSSGDAFTITPAAVKISPASSYFKVTMRHTSGNPIEVAVSVSDTALKPVRNSLSLAVNELKTLTVNYDGLKLKNNAVLTLSAGAIKYEIIAVAPKSANATAQSNATAQNQSTEETISFEGQLVTVKNITVIKNSAPVNRPIAGALEFKNNAKLALHDLAFTSSGISLAFNETSVSVLEPGAVYSQYIWINKLKDAAAGTYFGTITLTSREGASLAIPLEIEFTPVAQEQPNATQSQQNVSVPLEKPGKVTVEKVNATLGIPLANFSELKQKSEQEKRKSLLIAVTISVFVIAIAFLFYLRIRPKTAVKKMSDYAESFEKPKKK
ncbi:MAG: hypothetical protein PHO02_03595 [Candidatus Nanoarchaeia archaeon]|nr:hypothetical protein [Candidatus Nanoarchaeia archaeon]